jgi:hypothetical protein
MAACGNGQHIVGAHNMAGFGDFCPIQAHAAGHDQLSGHGALPHDAGEPEPFVQALRQFFLPII